ncbi:hypothetical protein KIW84_020175 [Lathyrus oleraceus]|uniref:Uncharacterized protein n=1 Tax=Pisum sativum TaxID=3888 RepID=A0A9D4Y6P2_PEA|nr:hypothetical protein KIW84_020175 [Pisum sativum]
MQSKEGFTSNKSFKIWVNVKNRDLLTLIDSGATSNFIDSRLVKELGMNVVETPTYVIEVDMVLGMDWLASLGNNEANFGELCFEVGTEGPGVGFYLQTLKTDTGELPQELTERGDVLNGFEEVFNLPAGLPPIREHDHAIRLKDDEAIPNLKPYRYPFFQKK